MGRNRRSGSLDSLRCRNLSLSLLWSATLPWLTLNHSKLCKARAALEWILIVNIHRGARNHGQQKHNEIKGPFDTSRTIFQLRDPLALLGRPRPSLARIVCPTHNNVITNSCFFTSPALCESSKPPGSTQLQGSTTDHSQPFTV